MKKIVTFVCLLSCVLLLTSCMSSKYSRVVGDYDTSKLKGSFVSSETKLIKLGKTVWIDRCSNRLKKHGMLSSLTTLLALLRSKRHLTLIRSRKRTISFIRRMALICLKVIPLRLRNSAKMFRTSSRYMEIVSANNTGKGSASCTS